MQWLLLTQKIFWHASKAKKNKKKQKKQKNKHLLSARYYYEGKAVNWIKATSLVCVCVCVCV